ncbi:MAG: hypothetical protein Q4G68_13295 [Planctomycetia bacterium]|nr:hypothetical protein [Planctomycetia bacterium]
MSIINYNYLGRRYLGGGLEASGNRYFDFEETYELARVEDLPSFLAFLSPVGRLVHRFPPFRIQSSRVLRISEPKPDGKVILAINVHCATEGRGDFLEYDLNGNPVTENTPPWLCRARNVRMTSVGETEHATRVWPVDSERPAPFMNTAGVTLQADISRGLSQLSFSYCLQSASPNFAWQYPFKTNRDPICLLGLNFPARGVLIQSLSVQPGIDRNPDTGVRWRYVRIDIQFLIDPDGFNKDYRNVGTSVRTIGGLMRLWNWNRGTMFGSYNSYLESGYDDGEEVNEPLYLDNSGMFVSPFDENGHQRETWLRGCVYEPADFSPLWLPEVY